MQIKQFKYSRDNLGYLVYSGGEGVAIDGGAVDDILSFADENSITIKIVTNTHSHQDHTMGNSGLLAKTTARFLDCKTITSDQSIEVGPDVLTVFPTPGHIEDCVTFAAQDFLVTGDTLFNGTVGNCFSGDLKSFFNSLKRLMAFPEHFKIYAGHDYVKDSLTYARLIEKDNPDIDEYEQKYSPDLVVSTLSDELKVNPYIRFNAEGMIENLKQKGVYSDDEFKRFEAIMELY